MAKVNCDACSEIRELDPNLVVNGWSSTECASMANDTGLSPSSGHNDCTDLELMNDCLIGNLDAEVDSYEVCDWKTFMHRFLPNLWTLFSAIKCAICGIWTNIHKLWTEVNNIWNFIKKLRCEMDYLYNGASFSFGEYTSDTKSHIVAGKGVSFLNVSASGTSSDISMTYVGGGLAHIGGSVLLYDDSFTDASTVYNYDTDGVNPRQSKSRMGNSDWQSHDKNPLGGSQLVYEIRLLKSEFPQIQRFFSGVALNAAGGGYHCQITRTGAGKYADGQSGHCDHNTGAPANDDSSRGHLVPEGWEYIQLRISWIENLSGGGKQYTPVGLLGMRMNQSKIDC